MSFDTGFSRRVEYAALLAALPAALLLVGGNIALAHHYERAAADALLHASQPTALLRPAPQGTVVCRMNPDLALPKPSSRG